MKVERLLVLMLILALVSCKQKESSNMYALTAEQFEKEMAKPSEKIILDVRTPAEFNEGHIRNAMLIDFNGDNFMDEAKKLDKQIPLYIYCASGVRSDKAAHTLRAEGFREVYVLADGLNAWRNANKEIIQ